MVDLDKARKYPLNYVCLLPKNIVLPPDSPKTTVFHKLFQEPMKTAVDLLLSARKEYQDLYIQQEIDSRIAKIYLTHKALLRRRLPKH